MVLGGKDGRDPLGGMRQDAAVISYNRTRPPPCSGSMASIILDGFLAVGEVLICPHH